MGIADFPPAGPGLQGAAPLHTRRPHAGRAVLPVLGEMALALGRVHELCGSARRTLALAVAGACGSGPVMWIAPSWAGERLNGQGVTDWIDPGRLLLVQPDRTEDVLWAMEEALRSGTVPVVMAELPEPPALTPIRRLHLAAEAGCAGARCAPLGLILTPGEGGAAGVESRWRFEPDHRTAMAMGWRLACLRARAAAPGLWAVRGMRGPDRRWMLRTKPS